MSSHSRALFEALGGIVLLMMAWWLICNYFRQNRAKDPWEGFR